MNIFENMNYSAGAVMVMSSFVALLGFLVENLWLLARKKYIDNRNMHAPFLLGYGIAITGFYFIFGTPSNLRFFGEPCENKVSSQFAAYFLITFVLVSLGEIILGTVIEKTCGLEWWNYTSIPMHVTKYTSVPTSLCFSVLIVTFMDCFYEPIMNRLMEFDPKGLLIYGLIVTAVMLVDFIMSMWRMKTTGKLMTTWRLDFGNRYFLRSKDFSCRYKWK